MTTLERGAFLSQRQTLEITGREEIGDSVFYKGRIEYGEATLRRRKPGERAHDTVYNSYSVDIQFPDRQGLVFYQWNPQDFGLGSAGYWHSESHERDSKYMTTVNVAGETLFLQYSEGYVVQPVKSAELQN